ncbi:MAG: TonB C-terminal domain-containing protein [Desulfobacteraceae bacterium]|nr:TonB C-terminal domain-containing protein [Desulfobacteraceae bacterium]
MLKTCLLKIMGINIFSIFCVLCLCSGCYSQLDNNKHKDTTIAQSEYTPMDIWHVAFFSTIQKNWTYDPGLTGLDQKLEVHIILKILKTGYTKYIRYDSKSGNELLDEVAMNTVLKSIPFQKLPKDIEFYEVGIIFSPRGLK